jgi:hypothetical protein
MTWRTLEAKLKAWLREWLGIDLLLTQNEEKKKLSDLTDTVETLFKLQEETAASFQRQIDALSQNVPTGTPEKKEEEPAQIMPGHMRWSQRKRQYIEQHRAPATTPAGEQIEANNRLIAAGVKAEKHGA